MPGSLGYRVPMFDRFMAKVDMRSDGCWEWTGMRLRNPRLLPYGYLWLEGRMVRAHRLAYELFVGSIPEQMFVLHTCDRAWCVNPDHLWLGDASDNMRDCVAKGRHGNQWGTAGICGLR